MRIGVVDNYDSFTYNLVHYLEEISGELPFVCMNDRINWNELGSCSHIVLSPGPGLPKTSGELMRVIDVYHSKKNILGVCLGMQAIGEYFGARLTNLTEVKHGVQHAIRLEHPSSIYVNLPDTIEVGRYHSWVVDKNNFPETLRVTSWDEEENIMSLEHRSFPIHAVQYHPESVMTGYGKAILKNWLTGS